MSKTIKALLFGAGQRGTEAYGAYALANPDQVKFVAVAEPVPFRRESFARQHDIPDSQCYESWEDSLSGAKIADVVVNATPDRVHYPSGIAALQAGYDMLLEKPICTRLEDAANLVHVAEETGRYLQVCHVLRFTDFFRTIQQTVRSGRLGQLITISHRENVSSWHMAHSYVRGNWRREEDTAPMLLTKSCHDLDLLYWFVGKPAKRITSFGSLRHFRPENAPEGAPARCTDGCPVEKTCPFYAPSIYIGLYPIRVALSQAKNPIYRFFGKLSLWNLDFTIWLAGLIPPLKEFAYYGGWPRSVISNHPSDRAALLKALQEGPYGRCVYRCDNDVVDHQVVEMEFGEGTTADFSMLGHSHEEGRTLRIDGSHASLLGRFGYNAMYIEIHDHRSLAVERMEFPNTVESGGHGGGDFGLMEAFIKTLRGESQPESRAREALESHVMAFAAERSRRFEQVVDLADFRQQFD